MTNENIYLWSRLAFKTRSYRKNYDLITTNENIITEYEGSISQLQIKERLLPILVGEFAFSIWNLKLGRMLEFDLEKLIKDYELEDSYVELGKLMRNNEFNIANYDRIIIVHNFVLRADYRKKGITEELIETMYRDHYGARTAMIVLTKPIQNNVVDNDYYKNNHKALEVFREINDEGEMEKTKTPAYEYYSLNELHDKEDVEFNEYKLFAVADRCGFTRLGESRLFLFNPDKTIVRMLMKMKKIKQLKY